jgi:hypothetical protein
MAKFRLEENPGRYVTASTSTKYWVSRDGRITLIRDMDQKHLVNTIQMLRRGHIEAALPLLREKNKLLRDTQLQMLGFRELTVHRYHRLLREFLRRERLAAEKEETLDTQEAELEGV